MSKLDNIILECINKALDQKEEKLGDYVDPTKEQIKDLFLELIGEPEGMFMEDVMTELDRKIAGMHPQSNVYHSVMREHCMTTGKKIGEYGIKEDLIKKVKAL